MEDKKRDLIPIAAIAVFLVIIILLCVGRLNAKKRGQMEENRMPQTTAETMTAQETEAAEGMYTETVQAEDKDTARRERPPKEENGEKDTDESDDNRRRTISGNDPLAAADGVNKSNREMLQEMYGYWEKDNMDAVYDLAHLGWFMKMSQSIVDEDTFYYYGERNDLGQPDGTGLACYAGNSYYFGSWAAGRRSGEGKWIKYYMYYDDDIISDRAYTQHMYMGEWANDMPNGEGQEHFELDMAAAANKGRYVQNVLGTFRDGLYNGEMFLTTLDFTGNQEEWNGLAEEGIWNPYGAASNLREVPVCQDVGDEHNYLWLAVKENKDRGIEELMP